jgi:hypothetical protein
MTCCITAQTKRKSKENRSVPTAAVEEPKGVHAVDMPESLALGPHGLTPPAQPLAEHKLPLRGWSSAWSHGSSGGRPSYRHPGALRVATTMLALRMQGSEVLPAGWRQTTPAGEALTIYDDSYSSPSIK